MLAYDVMTEEDAQRTRFKLLPDGEYDALVISALDRVSASGNPMTDLSLTVYDEHGQGHSVRDFLVYSPQMMWKPIHFCKSANLMAEYEAKKFCDSLAKDKYIRVLIRSQKGGVIPEAKLNGKPPGSCYPDKNVVADYVERTDAKAPNARVSNETPFNDDIPF